MNGLDQGTILFGLRSSKYPGIPCYGIVITASCDISNDKVGKLYFLVGVDVKRWFCTEYAYHQVYDNKINHFFKSVENMCERFSLDAHAIRSFTAEEVDTVIRNTLSKKSDWDHFNKSYQQYADYYQPGMSDEDRRLAIQRDTKVALTFLKEIEKEKIFHYFFLPKAAYLENTDQKDDGLIVDLQEIGTISMQDARQIIGRGIDNLLLVGENREEQTRFRAQFWLEDREDFVGIEGKVISPWREHLMQRFIRDFARIGLNGATEKDYEKLVQSI